MYAIKAENATGKTEGKKPNKQIETKDETPKAPHACNTQRDPPPMMSAPPPTFPPYERVISRIIYCISFVLS